MLLSDHGAAGEGARVELYEVMRSTFSAREFTDAPLSDETLARIFEQARFAPTGGNRQGWRVIVVRDPEAKAALAELAVPTAKRYAAQMRAGESPWNAVTPTTVDADTIARTPAPAMLSEPLAKAPVVLVVCVDLRLVASTDQYLPRVGVISGASIYPFVWNILLAARNEGYGGTITTLAVAEEPKLKALLSIPEEFAVAAVMPMGRPPKQLTRLKRRPVSEFAVRERWDGAPLPSS
jgi:nitroreductase